MITDPALEQRLLDTFGFLKACDEQIYKNVLQNASLARLKKAQFICHEGSECGYLALILKGSARVYKLGENAREITLYRIGPGQSCILTASCLLTRQPFPAFAVCEEEIEAVLIPAGRLQRWMAESPPWRDYIFGLVAKRMANIISLVEEVVFRRMDQRIAAYLAGKAETDTGDTLRVTHQKIASDLGTSREVVSRILKDFETLGLVEVSRGAVRICRRQALEEKGKESL